MEAKKPLLNDKEAAEFLGYNHLTLKNSRHTGVLAGVEAPGFCKIGKRTVRYKFETLTRWLDQFEERTCTRPEAAAQ